MSLLDLVITFLDALKNVSSAGIALLDGFGNLFTKIIEFIIKIVNIARGWL